MDKTIENGGIEHADCSVHRLKRGARPFHEKYGLRISAWSRDSRSRASSEVERPRYFEFYGISQLLDGRGFFWRPGCGREMQVVESGQAIVVCPRVIHNYGGYESHYTEDTINFSGPLADHLFASGILSSGLLTIGEGRPLLPIIEWASDPSDEAQLQANMALQNLLVEWHLRFQEKDGRRRNSKLNRLVEALKRTPEKWWTVEEMAGYCGLSPSRFRVVFRQAMGVSPKAYLDNLKLNLAAEDVVRSSDSIAKVALKFGYEDPFHFSRRFKAVTGFSPGQYRRQMRFSKGVGAK